MPELRPPFGPLSPTSGSKFWPIRWSTRHQCRVMLPRPTSTRYSESTTGPFRHHQHPLFRALLFFSSSYSHYSRSFFLSLSHIPPTSRFICSPLPRFFFIYIFFKPFPPKNIPLSEQLRHTVIYYPFLAGLPGQNGSPPRQSPDRRDLVHCDGLHRGCGRCDHVQIQSDLSETELSSCPAVGPAAPRRLHGR